VRKKLIHLSLAIAVFLLFVPSIVLAEESGPNILFIFDSSGSMMDPIGDAESKVDAAKRVLSDLVGSLPAGTNVGLEAYGHTKKVGCDDIEVLVPVSKLNVDMIRQKINSLEALGNTPIASALEKGANEIRDLKGERTMVLISDGEETCKGDPISAAEQIRKRMGIDVIIQVIGFDVDDKTKQQLAGIAKAGGGNYYAAKDARQLKESLVEIKDEAIVEKKEPPKELFVEEFDEPFSSEEWEIINDNPDNRVVEDGNYMVITSLYTMPVQNMLIYNKGIPVKNYAVTTKFSTTLLGYNSFDSQYSGLILYLDKDNFLALTVYGDSYINDRFRQVVFNKIHGGKKAVGHFLKIGGPKELDDYLLKIEKRKHKYTAYWYNPDPEKEGWKMIGTHTVLGKKFRPGLVAYHHDNRAKETVTEYDSFKITELQE